MKEIVLRRLSPSDGKDCYELLQNIGRQENDFTNPVHDMSFDEFKSWLQQQDDWSKGENLPNGYVPQVCYWLIEESTPVGFGKIRLGLTEQSRLEGGNLGYAIDSRHRGKGLGSKLLELLVLKTKEMKLESPLVTVKKFNYASKRVAEHNGGKLVKETEGWWYFEM